MESTGAAESGALAGVAAGGCGKGGGDGGGGIGDGGGIGRVALGVGGMGVEVVFGEGSVSGGRGRRGIMQRSVSSEQRARSPGAVDWDTELPHLMRAAAEAVGGIATQQGKRGTSRGKGGSQGVEESS